ncbi:hypothetical protein AB3662_05595 [Sorangium cellulosum]|uniref:hypothetical protein n=1 Tax=Sorangium cellulosum TaxID=56 RepID=UPI003D9A16F8
MATTRRTRHGPTAAGTWLIGAGLLVADPVVFRVLQGDPAGTSLRSVQRRFLSATDPAAALPEDAVGLDALLDNVSLYWFVSVRQSAS